MRHCLRPSVLALWGKIKKGEEERRKERRGKKKEKREEGGDEKETRPDTRPPVADGWAGAEVRVFTLFDSCSPTDRPTDGRTDGRTKPLIELRVRN